ncbi:biotin-dependent carboxyltransferase family protein [Tomitella biformata]|uniref:5-oxoprolinase subunit C family protein n=1 Tax=Tomitella biformata TaxID=630403 RepID=UPI0004656485|nr:biotin-dependent carboxyltransferase family protein [Tomitella biformata]
MSALEVLSPGPLTTVQDEGRRGVGALGVGRSGAADLPAYRAANRLAGNVPGAACLETTAGGLRVRAHGQVLVAVTGPRTAIALNGHPVGDHALIEMCDGCVLAVAAPVAGLRNYVAVRGGIHGEAVLGSQSTDLLSGLGPPPLRPGDVLRVGTARAQWPAMDFIPTAQPKPAPLFVTPGPRADWFTPAALAALTTQRWKVTDDANRVGVRLGGVLPLERSRHGELPSEGMAVGSVQVPADGQPVLFLADHPPTGGYPVIAVLRAHSVASAAQLRPGDQVRFQFQR